MGLFRRKVDPKVLERQKELGIIAQMGAFYEFGLPIEPGTKFNLLLDNISDISVRVGANMRAVATNDVGGAIAGAMIAGPIGAIVGESISRGTIRDNKIYMIITYRSADKIGRIGFGVTGVRNMDEFEELFAKRPKKEIEVNL